ncbi:uncharacterized protein LOC118647291 [Monomorium pharaonis]|uniref:uncharacterized protein LOC118647291 n=1 Tax=Monomorium pharaonis TaxID=307658 RepID=UPI001746E2DF|nr:uncharacterized protein LOC118647291 [Monomorium pharaonis]XP_036147785.1 uncharacterized protein LOC118647291 [Monomorium pharaonis]
MLVKDYFTISFCSCPKLWMSREASNTFLVLRKRFDVLMNITHCCGIFLRNGIIINRGIKSVQDERIISNLEERNLCKIKEKQKEGRWKEDISARSCPKIRMPLETSYTLLVLRKI